MGEGERKTDDDDNDDSAKDNPQMLRVSQVRGNCTQRVIYNSRRSIGTTIHISVSEFLLHVSVLNNHLQNDDISRSYIKVIQSIKS